MSIAIQQHHNQCQSERAARCAGCTHMRPYFADARARLEHSVLPSVFGRMSAASSALLAPAHSPTPRLTRRYSFSGDSSPPRTAAVNTIFVGNLPFSVTDDQLRDYFGEAGTVAHVRIAEDFATGRRKGYAHIEFEESESASKALEYSGQELEGRPLRIDLSAPRGALPPHFSILGVAQRRTLSILGVALFLLFWVALFFFSVPRGALPPHFPILRVALFLLSG